MLNIHMFQPLSHRPFIYIINQQVLATNPQIRDHSTESQMYGCNIGGDCTRKSVITDVQQPLNIYQYIIYTA